MTGILGQLKWESLKKRRKDKRLILLYKGLKGKARIPTDDHIPTTRRGRNQHSLAFQIPSASKDVYKYSFFPQSIRDWNDLPESLISSSELSDDSVIKFTSLVRARDLFPPVTAPGEGLSIWRFTSKLFRFRFRVYTVYSAYNYIIQKSHDQRMKKLRAKYRLFSQKSHTFYSIGC